MQSVISSISSPHTHCCSRRAALVMHDLQLAYMVIAHSQRDPGEYMLELQGFASAPSPALQKHAIDMHLGRWLPALQHLLAAGDEHFDAALRLAQDKVSHYTAGIVSFSTALECRRIGG